MFLGKGLKNMAITKILNDHNVTLLFE